METTTTIKGIENALGEVLLAKVSQGIIHKSWDDYPLEINKHRRNKSHKALTLNNEMIENAKDIFGDDDKKDIYMLKKRNLWVLIVKTGIYNFAIRFNKLEGIKGGIRLALRNKTEQLSLFLNQDSLFGFPLTEIKLIAGWLPDKEGLNIQSFIICTDSKNHNLGEIPLTGYYEGSVDSMVTTTPPTPIQTAPTTKRVYKKTDSENPENTEK